MNMDHPTSSKAKLLWDYNNMSMLPQSADLLLIMGTNDLGVPKYAANVLENNEYKYIVTTGGVFHEHSLRLESFNGLEADIFAEVLVKMGGAQEVFRERNAKNTGDNIVFSRQLLCELGKNVKTGQLIHTPTMGRRALATAQKQWSEIEWCFSCQKVSFEQYVEGLDIDRFINDLVGDTYRIIDYPSKGFQTEQEMPSDVRSALFELIEVGYDRRIPKR